MGDKTRIGWTESTWNPVTGCTKVSDGCTNCYAETFAERWRGIPGHIYEGGFDLQLRPARLEEPLAWRRPRRVFVNSMSDLFHDQIPDDYIAKVFAVMACTPRHTYQLLTKRHGRMRSWLNNDLMRLKVYNEAHALAHRMPSFPDASVPWPLPNLWVGVSVEDQHWADIRIPALIDTPAAVRWLSMEPLLGHVDIANWLDRMEYVGRGDADGVVGNQPATASIYRPSIGWVVVGGESGHGARYMHPDWALAIRFLCADLRVPFFFKQAGNLLAREWGMGGKGEDWDSLPVDLAVREYPTDPTPVAGA